MRTSLQKVLSITLTIHLGFTGMPLLVSSTERPVSVESLQIVSNNETVIVLSQDADTSSFDAFTLPSPPKIVIDITDATLTADSKKINGSDGSNILRFRAAQHATAPERIVRLVLDLKKMVDYEVKTEEKTIIITLGDTPADQHGSAHDSTGNDSTQSADADLTRDEYLAEFEDEDESDAEQTDRINVNIMDNLSMQPVTLDFNQADLQDVFRILQAKSGVNIISGDDIEGELTIHLEQVPFQEAFKTILSLKGLVAQQVGRNILRIITPEALSLQRAKAVTFWRVFPLNYANAQDASTQINAMRTAQGRRGSISVDTRTNSLIVADSPEGLDDVARLIHEIDKKPQQVLIESRFVEVSLDSQFGLGIEWGYYSLKRDGNKTTEIGSAVVETDVDVIGGTTADLITVNPLGAGVAATVPGQIGGFTFAQLDNKVALLAHLSALASKGKAKFLSNPKITTLNNQEANIWIGSQIPIRTTTLSQEGATENVVYKQVGISLRVTPTINADKRITLKVRPEVSLPDTSNISPAGDIPINTRFAETTVLIRNNETLVIGGFIEESKTDAVSKVPLLGDIPILGQFFRSNFNTKRRRELLVFITPKIIED